MGSTSFVQIHVEKTSFIQPVAQYRHIFLRTVLAIGLTKGLQPANCSYSCWRFLLQTPSIPMGVDLNSSVEILQDSLDNILASLCDHREELDTEFLTFHNKRGHRKTNYFLVL